MTELYAIVNRVIMPLEKGELADPVNNMIEEYSHPRPFFVICYGQSGGSIKLFLEGDRKRLGDIVFSYFRNEYRKRSRDEIVTNDMGLAKTVTLALRG